MFEQNTYHFKVLLFGAGFVSHPFAEYMTRFDDTYLTVVSSIHGEVHSLCKKFQHMSPVVLDVTKESQRVEQLINSHDLIISLLPHPLHPVIAEFCIAQKKNLVTASYATPVMKEFHQRALDAGISILMEVGLDPGIDHMLAMECFEDIRARNGKITSFVSWCGGLPAPEVADNPLRYKFSWFPMGVLMSVAAPSKYLMNGKVVEKAKVGDNLRTGLLPIDFMSELNLEGIPNRDATLYRDEYQLYDATTAIRGTLRYKGYADIMVGLLDLGVVNHSPSSLLSEDAPNLTWKQFIALLLNADENIPDNELKSLVYEAVGRSESRLRAIEGLGLLSDAPVNKASGNPMSSLAHHLSSRLAYKSDERDMVVMRHEIEAVFANGAKEKHNVDLVEYGDPNKYTAMAKTVGYPCAIAARMLLLGKIQEKGMLLPITECIYKPVLEELRRLGFQLKVEIV